MNSKLWIRKECKLREKTSNYIFFKISLINSYVSILCNINVNNVAIKKYHVTEADKRQAYDEVSLT